MIQVRKLDVVLGVLVAAVVLLTWAPRMTGPIDLRWDAGVYYVLGTSLAEGKGYRLLNEPGEIEATQYPPLLPTVVALHQLAAGTSDPSVVGQHLRITFLLLSIGLGLACYSLLRRYLAAGWAFAATCAFLLHVTTVFLSDLAFTEVPYAIVTILVLALLRPDASRGREVGTGLLIVAAFLLRTTGVVLFVAWVAEAVLRKRPRRAALRFALVAPVVLGWQLYVGAVERSPSYAATSYEYQRADYLFYNVSYGRNVRLADPARPEAGVLSVAGMARRVATNLAGVPRGAGEAVSAARFGWDRQVARAAELPVLGRLLHPRVAGAAILLLGFAALIGLGALLFRREYTMPLYAGLYVAAVSVTPYATSDAARYWFPIAPLLIAGVGHLAMLVGGELGERARERLRAWARRGLAAAVGLVLLVQLGSLFDLFNERHQVVAYQDLRGERLEYRLFNYRDTYRALDDSLDRLRAEAPPNAVVAASMPHWVHLRTGLRAVMPPFERDPARALELLNAVPTSYLVVDGRSGSFTRVFGLPAIQHAPEQWEPIFTDADRQVEAFRHRSVNGGVH